MKKIVQRMCMGCNEKKDKRELLRIVMDNEKKIQVDKTGKLEGRGAYICNNKKCLEKIIKSKRLEKVFKINIDEKIYEDIRGVIIDNENENN